MEPLGYGRIKTTLPDYVRPEQKGSLTTFLGMFSLGLGLAEVLAARKMGKLTGVRNTTLLRSYGAREIVSGLGILRSDRPSYWVWSRVLGDAIDLGTLAAYYSRSGKKDQKRIVAAAVAVAGVTVADVVCATEHAYSRR